MSELIKSKSSSATKTKNKKVTKTEAPKKEKLHKSKANNKKKYIENGNRENFQIPTTSKKLIENTDYKPEYLPKFGPYRPIKVNKPVNRDSLVIYNESDGFDELHVFSADGKRSELEGETGEIIIDTRTTLDELLFEQTKIVEKRIFENDRMNEAIYSRPNKKGEVSILTINDKEDRVIQTSEEQDYYNYRRPIKKPATITQQKQQDSTTVVKTDRNIINRTKITETNLVEHEIIDETVDMSLIHVSEDTFKSVEYPRNVNLLINCPKSVLLDHLKILVNDPDSNQVIPEIKEIETGYQISFVPIMVGDYLIEIFYNGKPIYNSPFKSRVFDSRVVKVIGLKQCYVSDYTQFKIDASQAGAGNLEIIVTVDDHTNVPNSVKEAGENSTSCCYLVSFTPEIAKQHQVSIKFNGKHIPGSPFNCNVIDKTGFKAEGHGLSLVPIRETAIFFLNAPPTFDNHMARIQVDVKNFNSGDIIKNQIEKIGRNEWKVDYVPYEIGKYEITASINDINIDGSPFYPEVYDLNKVIVTGIKSAFVGQKCTFQVDCKDAGEGNLTVKISSDKKKTVVTKIHPKGSAIYDVVFLPTDDTNHKIEIIFNDKQVKGSPFNCHVFDTTITTIEWDKVHSVPVNKRISFDIDVGETDPNEEIIVKIFNPLNKEEDGKIINKNRMITVEFTPKSVGNYNVFVLCKGHIVAGSPFTCSSYDLSKVSLRNVENNGKIGDNLSFVIDTSQAGDGDLDVEVVCCGELIKTKREKLKNGLHKYTYTVERSYEHYIDVLFNLERIEGCPYKVVMAEQNDALKLDPSSPINVPAHQMAWIGLIRKMEHIAIKDLVIAIQAPNGESIPAKFGQLEDKNFKIEYSPVLVGDYLIEVAYGKSYVAGTPFKVTVFDPTKIQVKSTNSGVVGEKTEVSFIIEEAGVSELGLTIKSPNDEIVVYETQEIKGGYLIKYKLSEIGAYKVYITFGGIEVIGSPFVTNAIDKEPGSIEVYGNGLIEGIMNKESSFEIIPKEVEGELSIQVTGPNEKLIKCQTDQKEAGVHVIKFIPKLPGEHVIAIKMNGKNVPGSPWRPKIIDPNEISVVGGWESHTDDEGRISLGINEKKRIEFLALVDGILDAEIRGPDGQIDPVISRISGTTRYNLEFIPNTVGEYYITVSWNGIILPDCPFYGFATSQTDIGQGEIYVRGKGANEAKVDRQSEFIVDGKGYGRTNPEGPQIDIVGVKNRIDVTVTRLIDGRYKCIYRPRSAGAYLIYIKWGDKEVNGSPFKLNVSGMTDVTKVICDYTSTKDAYFDKEIVIPIDVKLAGPGELTAECYGPKVAANCSLVDQKDGTYNLLVVPNETGSHVLHIRYSNDYVIGCPLDFDIKRSADIGFIKVKGHGIQHGLLATFDSNFTIETEGAGPGDLAVKIKGPRQAFKVGMKKEEEFSRTILCTFEPTEIGPYEIFVTWCGMHVQGSPFRVQIFDTEEELKRYLSARPEEKGHANTLLRPGTKNYLANMTNRSFNANNNNMQFNPSSMRMNANMRM